MLSPVPHLGLAKIDWDEGGPAYAERILASLERLLARPPQARRDAADLHARRLPRASSTPIKGSAFSVAPRLTQSAWFRPHNRDPQIPGLYIVGAGTHPGRACPA